MALLAAAFAVSATACGKDNKGATATATLPAAEATATAPAASTTPQAAASVVIGYPAAGDTVSSPVTLAVSASGIEIAKATDAVSGAAHFHAFVDLDPVAEGETVPQDTPGIFHFATDTLDLDLAAGEHTVTVVLGDNTHVRLEYVPAATVTFTVE